MGRRLALTSPPTGLGVRSEEHTSELQSRRDLVCRLLLESSADTRDLHSFPTRRSSDLSLTCWASIWNRRALMYCGRYRPIEARGGPQPTSSPSLPFSSVSHHHGPPPGVDQPAYRARRQIGRAHV